MKGGEDMWKVILVRDDVETILECIDEDFTVNVTREIVYDDKSNALVRSPISYLELRGKMVKTCPTEKTCCNS